MTVALKGTEGVSFSDVTTQATAALVSQADIAAMKARLAAYDERYKTRWNTRRVTNPVSFGFSNDGLTATRLTNLESSYRSAISTPSGYAEKIYCEVTVSIVAPARNDYTVIGIGKPWGIGPDTYIGSNTWGGGVFGHGMWYYNASNSGGYTQFNDGQTVGIAYDANVGNMFFRNVTTNGVWNLNASADPAASPAVGGLSGIYSARSPCCVYFTSYYSGASCVLNCDGPFLGVVPAGYRRWTGKPI
jgi:hypothetical protein